MDGTANRLQYRGARERTAALLEEADAYRNERDRALEMLEEFQESLATQEAENQSTDDLRKEVDEARADLKLTHSKLREMTLEVNRIRACESEMQIASERLQAAVQLEEAKLMAESRQSHIAEEASDNSNAKCHEMKAAIVGLREELIAQQQEHQERHAMVIAELANRARVATARDANWRQELLQVESEMEDYRRLASNAGNRISDEQKSAPVELASMAEALHSSKLEHACTTKEYSDARATLEKRNEVLECELGIARCDVVKLEAEESRLQDVACLRLKSVESLNESLNEELSDRWSQLGTMENNMKEMDAMREALMRSREEFLNLSEQHQAQTVSQTSDQVLHELESEACRYRQVLHVEEKEVAGLAREVERLGERLYHAGTEREQWRSRAEDAELRMNGRKGSTAQVAPVSARASVSSSRNVHKDASPRAVSSNSLPPAPRNRGVRQAHSPQPVEQHKT